MSRYPAYADYVDSGVEWLGQIPVGWNVSRVRYCTEFVTSGSRGWAQYYADEGYVFLRIANVTRDSINLKLEDVQRVLPPNGAEGQRTITASGDVLISITADLGSTGVIPDGFERAYISQHLALVRPTKTKLDGRWLAYQTLSVIGQTQLLGAGYGGTKIQLGLEDIKDVWITLPTLPEQQAIARFLDHKTALIDALIAKREALLTKLAEKRIALISQAVTRGLDPTAPLKDSGVAWLGDIPAHWEIQRQRFLMTMSGGMTPSTGNADFWDGDIPWVTPKDMKTERITSSIDRLTEHALEETAIRLYPSGCVLIVVRGMILAHTFPVAVNDIPVTINQDMKIIETVLNPEYLAILLRGMSQLILSTVEEAGHGTKVLRTDIYKNIRLPVPPKDEQRAIVQHVQKISTEMDQMMGYVKQAIAKLTEYRAALITSAVTGTIDVRSVPIADRA